jgi:hypothetical protein
MLWWAYTEHAFYITMLVSHADTQKISPAMRAEWNSCLLDYVQVGATGYDTDIGITVKGLKNCSLYKDRYENALIRDYSLSLSGNDSPAGRTVTQLEMDQKILTRNILALIRKIHRQ